MESPMRMGPLLEPLRPRQVPSHPRATVQLRANWPCMWPGQMGARHVQSCACQGLPLQCKEVATPTAACTPRHDWPRCSSQCGMAWRRKATPGKVAWPSPLSNCGVERSANNILILPRADGFVYKKCSMYMHCCTGSAVFGPNLASLTPDGDLTQCAKCTRGMRHDRPLSACIHSSRGNVQGD